MAARIRTRRHEPGDVARSGGIFSASDPVSDAARFNLGNPLLRQGREEEATAAFRILLEPAAKNPGYEQGLPLAAQLMAPAFVTADDSGQAVSSESLHGRFVLLDFWATRCGPCVRALPAVRQLAHYFPGTELTVVSVNEDAPDQDVWRKFIAEQKMDWGQVWDKNAAIYTRFHLAPPADLSLPRYVLLHRNGAVLRVYDGLDRLGLVVGQVVRTVTAASKSPQLQPRRPARFAFVCAATRCTTRRRYSRRPRRSAKL